VTGVIGALISARLVAKGIETHHYPFMGLWIVLGLTFVRFAVWRPKGGSLVSAVDPDTKGSTLITVKRAGGFWRDRRRRYVIMVDGRAVGRLREYEALSVEVSPGQHVIQVSIDHLRSQTLDVTIKASDTRRFTCSAGSINKRRRKLRYVQLEEDTLDMIRPEGSVLVAQVWDENSKPDP
jgi:hypothetical protein